MNRPFHPVDEAMFANILDVIADGVVAIDGDRHVVIYNATAERLLGYRADDVMGKPVDFILPPQVFAHHQSLGCFTRPEDAHQPLPHAHSTIIRRRPDGSEFALHVSVMQVTAASQTLLVAVIHEIAPRPETPDWAQRWQSFFEISTWGLAIIEHDANLTLSATNPAFAHMHGYSVEELRGCPLAVLLPPTEAANLSRIAELVRQSDRNTFESWHSRKDGTMFPVLVDMAVVFDISGQPLYSVLSVQDIPAHKPIETGLQDPDERYRIIVDSLHDGIVFQDAAGSILRCNASAEHILGLSAEQMMSRTSLDPHWRAIHEDGTLFPGNDHPAMIALRTGQPQCDVIMGVHKPDGMLSWIAITSQPLFHAGETAPYAVMTTFADITERKWAEQRLRESEERYRLLFDHSVDGIILSAPDGRIFAANPAACRLIGCTEEEISRAGRDALFDTTDPRLPVALEKRARAGWFSGELRVRRTNGSVFPADVTSVVYEDREGNLRTYLTVRDLTEHKRAEAALRAQEAQYREIFEATNDGMIINALDGRIVEVNPAACSMYGYTRDEMLRISPTALIHPDYGYLFEASMEMVREGKEFDVESVNIRRDGSQFDVDVRGRQFNYKGQPHVLVIVRDITARKNAETALREQEALLRHVLEVLPVGVWILDREGGIVTCNEVSRRIWGGVHYVGIDGYDKYKAWWADSRKPVAPEEWAGWRALLEDRQILEDTLEIEAFDGVHKIILSSAVPIHDAQGAVSGAIVIQQDVTERAQAYQLLEMRVAERTCELTALLEVSREVASTLTIEPLLSIILAQLKNVVDYTGAGIAILEGHEVVLLDYTGPVPANKMKGVRIPLEFGGGYRRVIEKMAPVIIDELWQDHQWLQNARGIWDERTMQQVMASHSWLGVPLVANGEAIGILRLDHAMPGHFTADHARKVLAFANQAALAIANARLYERAQQAAALEERQRLARDLHDSVSQALYGIVLGARTARVLLDRGDLSKVYEPIDYMLAMSEAAFAEMRALIFELRPDSLEDSGLVIALKHLAEVLRTRHRLLVKADFGEEPDLSLKAMEAIYRIAQEATNNTIKHAQAQHVTMYLKPAPGGVVLEIHDDGRGFEVESDYAGHYGLHSMRERVHQLNGTLEIRSAPHTGTHVKVWLPLE